MEHQDFAHADSESVRIGRVTSVSGSTVKGLMSSGDDAGSGSLATLIHAVRIGDLVKIRTPQSNAYGSVTALYINNPTSALNEAHATLELELICEIVDAVDGGNDTSFQRGVSIYPSLGAEILTTTREEIGQVYARPMASNVRIGSLHQDRSLPAYLITDELLGKHFAVLGTTGSGKSCSVALILHAILSEHRNGRIVLLDPHNEYASAFEGMSEVIDPTNLNLPYWLLNFEELVEVVVGKEGSQRETEIALLKQAVLDAKRKHNAERGDTAYITADTPIPYPFGDLIRLIDEGMGKLDKPENSIPYLRVKGRLENLRADKRFNFMFAGFKVQDTMADVISHLLRIPVAGKPVTIVDLSGVPSEIVDAVVSVMCRMIFDFALWSSRPRAFPVLLVCEEAHRYVPADSASGFGPTKNAIARIAKEGRKYGVSLALVSQRPSELAPGILSQCNTIFALRMSNERDHQFVHDALPEGALGLLNVLSSLKVQECIAVGEGVRVPMRIRFDDLDAAKQPRSSSAEFSSAWQDDVEDDDFIEDTVDRWRRQIR